MKKTIKYLLFATAAATGVIGLQSCKDDEKLPQIDGYNSSNEVAADNLKAHWTFDDVKTEDISKTEPRTDGIYGTVGFEEGKIGKALKLTKGAVKYPNIAALNTADALANFTVSLWVKIKNNKATTDEGYTVLFGLFPDGLVAPTSSTPGTVGDFMWGNILIGSETANFPVRADGDTLRLKGHFVKKNADGSINGQDNINVAKGTPPPNGLNAFKHSGEWVHFVVRWNSTTQHLDIFGNGASIGGYNDRSLGNVGPMRMNVPCSPLFGNGATKAVGFPNNPDQQTWSPMATASIDDVRVFNTALSEAEISALFNLGTAGR
jgi:hypothetical protein